MVHLNFSWANLAALNSADILTGKIQEEFRRSLKLKRLGM